jgi:iron complex outermembrane receptor protein
MKTGILLTTSVSALLSAGLVSAAQAQQGPPGRVTLEEITVTARRVEENLMKVPLSVTSLSAKDIEVMGLRDMTEISAFTPSFHFVNQVGGQSGLNDRSAFSITFRGLVLAPRATASGSGSLFIDGAPVIDAQAPGLDQIARVEVLKGPQSAYFGRSTFAGAINYVTRDPGNTFKGSVTGEYASFNSNDVALSLEGPVMADKLAIRVSGRHLKKGGSYINAADPSQRMGDQTTNSISTSILFTPTDDLRIKAFLNYFTNDDGPPAQSSIKDVDGIFNCNPTGGIYKGGYVCGPIPDVNRLNPATISGNFTMTPYLQSIISQNAKNYPLVFDPSFLNHAGLKRKAFQGDLRIDYDSAAGYTFASLTAYHYDKSMEIIDLDFRDARNIPNGYAFIPGTLPYYSFNLGSQRLIDDWSQELRLTSPTKERFRWSLGANYLYSYAPGFSLWGVTALGPLNLGGITKNRTQTPAIFGSASYDLTSELTFTTEARYQWDKVTTHTLYSGSTPTTGLAALPLQGTFKSFSPRVTLDYKYAADSMVYALWSRGYRPGGFNSYVVTATPGQLAQIIALGGNPNLQYLQERLDNYEAGWKATFLGGRARTTLALYYDKWRNGQISTVLNVNIDPKNPAAGTNQYSPVLNAGAVDLKGIEFSGDLQATDKLKLTVSMALNDTSVKQFSPCSDATNVTGATSCNGEVPSAPKWTWALSAEYSDKLTGTYDWFARIDYSHQGRQFVDYTNLAWVRSIDLVNARIGIRSESISIEGFVRNLTNDSTPNSTTAQVDPLKYFKFPPVPYSNEIRYALPDKRTFGIRARYNF